MWNDGSIAERLWQAMVPFMPCSSSGVLLARCALTVESPIGPDATDGGFPAYFDAAPTRYNNV